MIEAQVWAVSMSAGPVPNRGEVFRCKPETGYRLSASTGPQLGSVARENMGFQSRSDESLASDGRECFTAEHSQTRVHCGSLPRGLSTRPMPHENSACAARIPYYDFVVAIPAQPDCHRSGKTRVVLLHQDHPPQRCRVARGSASSSSTEPPRIGPATQSMASRPSGMSKASRLGCRASRDERQRYVPEGQHWSRGAGHERGSETARPKVGSLRRRWSQSKSSA